MKVKLRDVSNIIMGQSPDSSTYNTEKIGLPFFQGNADFGELNPIAKTWCSAPIKIAYKNYILISVRAPIGALNIAAETCCIGRGLAAFDVNNKMCTQKYLWYLLKAKKNELLSKGTGSTFKAISKNILSEMEFNIPPVREQELCTKVLDVVFCLIRLKKEQLDKLDLLVKSRFIEMFGDPVTNPLHWPICLLGEQIKFITSGSRGWAKYFTNDGAYFITIKNVKNSNIKVDDMQYIIPPNNAEAIRTKVQEGDLLISITADLGRTGVVSKEIAEHGGYINQHLTCVRLNQENVNPLYVSYYMESEAGKRQFNLKNQSAVKAGLNFNSIRSLNLMLPPIELQNDYISFVQQVDKSKLAIQQSLDELETLKKSLMQQYFG